MHSNQTKPEERLHPPPQSPKAANGPQIQPILVSYDQLQELGIQYSREHLRRLEAEEKFPLRIRLSPSRIAWMFHEVMAWLNERADARTQGPA